MSNNSTDPLQGAINRLEDATIRRFSNSFLLNILLLGMSFPIIHVSHVLKNFLPGIYTAIFSGTLYIYCKHAHGLALL